MLADAVLHGGLPLPPHAVIAGGAAAEWALYWSRERSSSKGPVRLSPSSCLSPPPISPGGAFVDLASRTADPDAWELERRVILSQAGGQAKGGRCCLFASPPLA